MAIFFSPKGDLVSANQSGVNFQKENILAAIWINFKNFQNFFENQGKSLGNIPFYGVRQHHNNLADKIMPLLAPSIPPGFEPHASLVAPEVFEQMRLYMNCSDPEERIIREAKMKKTLNELSQDPIAQRSCLRLESAPKVAPLTSEGRGRIFDFSRVQSDQILDGAESSSKGTDIHKRQRSKDPTERHQRNEVVETNGLMTSSSHRQDSVFNRTSDQFGTAPANLDDPKVLSKSPTLSGGFTVGVGDVQRGERGSRSKSSHKSKTSWTRRNQNKRRVSSAEHFENHLAREDAADLLEKLFLPLSF
ncbi:hypothetical protein YC2023_107048 [Brassica napus]